MEDEGKSIINTKTNRQNKYTVCVCVCMYVSYFRKMNVTESLDMVGAIPTTEIYSICVRGSVRFRLYFDVKGHLLIHSRNTD